MMLDILFWVLVAVAAAMWIRVILRYMISSYYR
jgi:hypothetical protein